MSEKKAKPHTKGNLVPEDLEYPSRAISRQGRTIPLQSLANGHETPAAQASERAEHAVAPVSAQSHQSASYSGTVMSEALQRQKDGSQKKASTGIGSAASGPKAAAEAQPPWPRQTQTHSFAQSQTSTMRQGAASTSAHQQLSRSSTGSQAHPATPPARQKLNNAANQSGSKAPSKERIEHIFDYEYDQERQYHQRQSVTGTQRKPLPQMPVQSNDTQWYPYIVPGSNSSLLLSIVVCLFLGFVLLATPLGQPLGLSASKLLFSNNPVFQSSASEVSQPLEARLTPSGEHLILGEPTISAQEIDYVLKQFGSPAVGHGKAFYELGEKYNIDPAYALAFFIHESSAGTNTGWAGLKPDGSSTHNVGNIICAGYKTCYNRFRDYASWEEGIEDWYRLLSVEYIDGRGTSTVEQIIPIYAPSFENNVPAYIDAVTSMVNEWRERGVN